MNQRQDTTYRHYSHYGATSALRSLLRRGIHRETCVVSSCWTDVTIHKIVIIVFHCLRETTPHHPHLMSNHPQAQC